MKLEKENDEKVSLLQEILGWVEPIIISIIIVGLIFTFVGRLVNVDGLSMYPTLDNNDKLIVTKLYRELENGDIVVLKQNNGEALVKRIIAIEGQTIDINFDNGEVFVDNKLITEEYINEPTYLAEDFKGPVTIPKGCVFVMGDNRNASKDSRDISIGMVNVKNIVGKVVFRVFPFDRIGLVN